MKLGTDEWMEVRRAGCQAAGVELPKHVAEHFARKRLLRIRRWIDAAICIAVAATMWVSYDVVLALLEASP